MLSGAPRLELDPIRYTPVHLYTCIPVHLYTCTPVHFSYLTLMSVGDDVRRPHARAGPHRGGGGALGLHVKSGTVFHKLKRSHNIGSQFEILIPDWLKGMIMNISDHKRYFVEINGTSSGSVHGSIGQKIYQLFLFISRSTET